MHDSRLTRAHLETLSTDDLRALADEIGLDLPDDLNRVFIISELLETNEDEDEEPEEDAQDSPGVVGISNLPVSYNVTFISVLLRDPLWAFVYWEVKMLDRQRLEGNPEFGGYVLRISSLPGSRAERDPACFDVPVAPGDSSRYLCLPGTSGLYRVELCATLAHQESVLARSLPFRVPRGKSQLNRPLDEAVSRMFSLSGVDKLHVLEGGDRRPSLSRSACGCDE